MELNPEMKRRYARQIFIPEIGPDGQKRLLEGSVGIVGCGALGSMVAMQLAGAGVGRIGIRDFDTIDLSNLQRQLFFDTDRCGQSKCLTLAERMNSLNPDISVEPEASFLTEKNAAAWLSEYDFIVEATDNPASKYLVDRICEEIAKGCCIAGVGQFSGQVSTFLPDSVIRFRQIFPEDNEGGITPCSAGGVLGAAAGVAASVQSAEAVKFLTGAGTALSGKLLVFNLLTCEWLTLPVVS